jgi:hypothetical protein
MGVLLCRSRPFLRRPLCGRPCRCATTGSLVRPEEQPRDTLLDRSCRIHVSPAVKWKRLKRSTRRYQKQLRALLGDNSRLARQESFFGRKSTDDEWTAQGATSAPFSAMASNRSPKTTSANPFVPWKVLAVIVFYIVLAFRITAMIALEAGTLWSSAANSPFFSSR